MRRDGLWLTGAIGAAGIAVAALSATAAPRVSEVPGKSQGDTEVDVELIFAIDISYSMDYDELKLQREVFV